VGEDKVDRVYYMLSPWGSTTSTGRGETRVRTGAMELRCRGLGSALVQEIMVCLRFFA
jgi:hypothetical protein